MALVGINVYCGAIALAGAHECIKRYLSGNTVGEYASVVLRIGRFIHHQCVLRRRPHAIVDAELRRSVKTLSR